jgi:diaminohydroxyphosphoribosylaminopyrimidine deaminase/5-amino-6-(5-phosphoribosylamino)uracil reductase
VSAQPGAAPPATTADADAMRLAIRTAADVRSSTSPNPWVGAVVLDPSGAAVATGATQPPGGDHAEVVALRIAGDRAVGGTLVVTLEPCSHHGRTPPCVDAILSARLSRVVIGTPDPDPKVAGSGVAALRAAGVDVVVGVEEADVRRQLRAYLHHRSTGRPYVVVKMAATLDGRTAAPDGSSRWITGESARADVHRLRAESDAVIVGAGTVRTDDPELTVRHVTGRDPRRVVLGSAPVDARCRPCLEWDGSLTDLLERLGADGCLQVLVEGGAGVVAAFRSARLVDEWVLYLAPAIFGGNDARPLLDGPTAPTIGELERGRIVEAVLIDGDLRIVIDGIAGPPGDEEA